jgi:hypothetical protein
MSDPTITEEGLDDFALELRATLETMLAGIPDNDPARLGSKALHAIRYPKRPDPACTICGKLMPEVYTSSPVAHSACVDYQARSRR